MSEYLRRYAIYLAIGMAGVGVAVAESSSADVGQLEEVVVTAQKRTENLQKVPISAVVVTSATLEQQNLNSLSDLADTVPGVRVQPSGRSDNLYIRGIGSGVNGSFDQSVGVFVDDIYYGRSRMTQTTFLDLDHVEVLKGPQSTFFGNNAIAGALNVVTKAPDTEYSAWARALYGLYGQFAEEGAVGGPISDNLAVRFAGTFNGTDGWVKNVYTGDDQPKTRNLGGRVSLSFKPNESLDALLKVEGNRNHNDSGLFTQIDHCPPAAPYKTAGPCATALALGLPTGLDNEQNANSDGQLMDLSSLDSALTVHYHLGEQTITAVSGFYNYDFNANTDLDGIPANLSNSNAPEKYHQFSQELRIASPVDQRVSYLAGVYYQTDRLDLDTESNFFSLTPTIAARPPFAALVPYLPLGQDIHFLQYEKLYSVFGSVTWNITDKLKLNGGVRGSWVDKDYQWQLFYGTATMPFGGLVPLPAAVATLPRALNLGVPGSLQGDRSDKDWMPSAQAQYQFDPEIMGYLSFSQGFKAGGFNGSDNSGVAANIPFKPEYVTAYEAGVKSEFFDKRFLFNLAAFRSNLRDLQVSQNVPTASGAVLAVVRNAASARSEGVEIETAWAVSRNFQLKVNGTYLNSFYISYPGAQPTTLQTFQGIPLQNLSGRPTASAPHASGSVTAAYTVPVWKGYRLSADVSGYLSSPFFLNSFDDPLTHQPGYSRWDARVGLTSPGGHWAVDLIGKNLTNARIYVAATTPATALGSVFAELEQPANVALQLRWKY